VMCDRDVEVAWNRNVAAATEDHDVGGVKTWVHDTRGQAAFLCFNKSALSVSGGWVGGVRPCAEDRWLWVVRIASRRLEVSFVNPIFTECAVIRQKIKKRPTEFKNYSGRKWHWPALPRSLKLKVRLAVVRAAGPTGG
jgi:hypothetical protein